MLASAPTAPSPALTRPQPVPLFHMSRSQLGGCDASSDERGLALNRYTKPDDVIMQYGICLQTASKAIDRVHAYITWLRSTSYRIRTDEDMQRVTALISTGFPAANAKALGNYARTFRSLLSCDKLPDDFSVTNGIEVASYEVGEEVDGNFVGKDVKNQDVTYWSAGVVISKRASTVQLSYQVFWLGCPPKNSGTNKNPTWSSVHVLRRHIEGTGAGEDTAWLDVEEIRTRYQQIMDEEKDDAPSVAAGSKAKPVARKSTGKPAPRPKRKTTVIECSISTDDDEDVSSSDSVDEPNQDPSGRATTNALSHNGRRNTQTIVVVSDQLSSPPAKIQKHQYHVPVATAANPHHPRRRADTRKGIVSVLKQVLHLCISIESIERLFQMHDNGELAWSNGKNIAVDLLYTVAKCHDELLSSNGRVPCGSVYDEVDAAVSGEWSAYENAQEWSINQDVADLLKQQWLKEMNEPEKWAMTRPIVKGAVGLCIWTILSYFPGLSFSSIVHNTGQTNEALNNRGMALLPSPFCNRLFNLLEENGFIDKSIHLPVFWDTAAVCISSNDSALSIQGSKEVQNVLEPFQVVDASDCLRFKNPPPFWGLDARVSWVKVSEKPDMWGEIGPKRKAIFDGIHELSSAMERTLIINTTEGFVLIFPSLHGTNRCLAKCVASKWQVCVNPVSELFENRDSMHLVTVDSPRNIRNGTCLDFGWRNFELEDHEKFFKAGCVGADDHEDTSLRTQKTHSDHRREVETSLFSASDRFNMEHTQWSSAEEWKQAGKNMKDVPPPTRTELGPMSFLGAFMPKTAIMITPKGRCGSGCVSTPMKLGGFLSFGGQVLLLLFLNLQTYMSHRNHTEDTDIRNHIDDCTRMHTPETCTICPHLGWKAHSISAQP